VFLIFIIGNQLSTSVYTLLYNSGNLNKWLRFFKKKPSRFSVQFFTSKLPNLLSSSPIPLLNPKLPLPTSPTLQQKWLLLQQQHPSLLHASSTQLLPSKRAVHTSLLPKRRQLPLSILLDPVVRGLLSCIRLRAYRLRWIRLCRFLIKKSPDLHLQASNYARLICLQEPKHQRIERSQSIMRL